MTSGNDRNDDPNTRGPDPNWWQGAPMPESEWQQQPGPGPDPGAQQPDPTWVAQPAPTTQYTGGYPQDPAPGHPYPAQPGYGGQPGYGQQQPAYGQQPGYGQQPPGFGQPPPYGGPPGGPPTGGGKGKGWLFAGIGVLVVAIIGAVVTVVLLNRDSSESSAKSNTTPSLISALTTESSISAKPSTSPKATTTKAGAPTAVVPGYQVVSIPDNGAVYDIPKDWKLDRTGQSSFGTGADQIPVAGLAQDGIEYCPNYVRTNVFLSQSTETDPAKAAADVGLKLSRAGWSSTTGATPGTAEEFTNSDGKLSGVFMEIKGSAPPPEAGCASTFSVYTFAFPGEDGAFVFTIAADTGVTGAVDLTLAKKILATIRPI